MDEAASLRAAGSELISAGLKRKRAAETDLHFFPLHPMFSIAAGPSHANDTSFSSQKKFGQNVR
jgi:hypothetical protein